MIVHCQVTELSLLCQVRLPRRQLNEVNATDYSVEALPQWVSVERCQASFGQVVFMVSQSTAALAQSVEDAFSLV